jgi:hypothetical protein
MTRQLYRVEILDVHRDEWHPAGVFATKESADIAAAKLVINRTGRIVAFTPIPVVTENGKVVVLDEQGRIALNSYGMPGTDYRYRDPNQQDWRFGLRSMSSNRLTLYRDEDDAELFPDAFEPSEGSMIAVETPEPDDPMDVALEAFHRKMQGKDR